MHRWNAHYHTSGSGSLYQGRFKSFPIQQDDHLLTVCRYVERNALRAGMVARAEAWRWSSLRQRSDATIVGPRLDAWPIAVAGDWVRYVNGTETEGELEALRRSVVRGAPYGAPGWQSRTAKRLGLQPALRQRGRPRKAVEG